MAIRPKGMPRDPVLRAKRILDIVTGEASAELSDGAAPVVQPIKPRTAIVRRVTIRRTSQNTTSPTARKNAPKA